MAKRVVLVHGILSSRSRTSLRKTESYYRSRGYDVVYVQYSPTDMATPHKIENRIRRASDAPGEVVVIGHSQGGLYVSSVSRDRRANTSYYTVNSPYASSHDNATDLKHVGDWSNLLQFIIDPEALMRARWSRGGHSVGQEQTPTRGDPTGQPLPGAIPDVIFSADPTNPVNAGGTQSSVESVHAGSALAELMGMYFFGVDPLG